MLLEKVKNVQKNLVLRMVLIPVLLTNQLNYYHDAKIHSIDAKLHSINTEDASEIYLHNGSLEKGPELEHSISGLDDIINQHLYITVPHSGTEIQIDDYVLVGHECLQVLDFTFSNDKGTKNGFKLSNNTIATNDDCRQILFTNNKKLVQYQQLHISTNFFHYLRDLLSSNSSIKVRRGMFNTMGRELEPMNIFQNHSGRTWKWILKYDEEHLRTTIVSNSVETKAQQFVQQHKDFEKEGFSDYMNGLFNGYIEGYNASQIVNNLQKE